MSVWLHGWKSVLGLLLAISLTTSSFAACEQEATALATAEAAVDLAYEAYSDAWDVYAADPSQQNAVALAFAEAVLDDAEESYHEAYNAWLECENTPEDPGGPLRPSPSLAPTINYQFASKINSTVSILETVAN